MERFVLFVNSINQIYRCIQKIKSSEMREFGLRAMHVMCLFHLNHSEVPLTSAQLSAICAEDKAAISRAIADLGEKGLVSFVGQDSGQKYRVPITLTEKGKEIARQMDHAIEQVLNKGGDGLTDEQRTGFYQALMLIADNLKNYSLEE